MNEEQKKLADDFTIDLVSLLNKYDCIMYLEGRTEDVTVEFKWQYGEDGIATRNGFDFQPGNFLP